MPAGTVLTVVFELAGQRFMGLNAGPRFPFTEAISLMVNCDTQEEIDDYWRKLTDGGREVACGWVKDRYGLSWQIVPSQILDMLSNGTPEQAGRVMHAVNNMIKLDIGELRRAFDGRA